MSDHRRPNTDDRTETAARAYAGTYDWLGFGSWEEMPPEERKEARDRVAAIIEALDTRLAPPVDGAWPCRTEPALPLPPRLRSFLYLILRDYVQPGDAEQAALQARDATERVAYSNPHLIAYADALASFLTSDGRADDDYPPPDESVIQRVRYDELKSGDLLEWIPGRWRRVTVSPVHHRDGSGDMVGILVTRSSGLPGGEVFPCDQGVARVSREDLP